MKFPVDEARREKLFSAALIEGRYSVKAIEKDSLCGINIFGR